MSFRQLLDHRVDVVRPSDPTTGDTLGDDQEVYSAVHAGVRCADWPILAPLGDYGAGETSTGRTMAWLEASTVPKDRDVLVTLSGPDAGKRWRIVANRSPGRRFGRPAHHREVECVPFEGDLPGYDVPVTGGGS
jgi:hypothetical protein